MPDLKKLAVDYFERHSDSQECHIASNGLVFHTASFAQSYVNGANLEDETIKPFKRKETLKVVKPVDAKPADVKPADAKPLTLAK
jgi:hypothetical protein